MFGYLGSMKCQPGHRDEVVAILMSGLDGLAAVGCQQYTVAVDVADDVTIWVTEVWLTKQAHDDSLELPETQDAIKRAMPMLTGEFSGTETAVYGGLGLPHLPPPPRAAE